MGTETKRAACAKTMRALLVALLTVALCAGLLPNMALAAEASSAAKNSASNPATGANMIEQQAAAKKPSVQYYVHRQTYGWEAKYSKRDGMKSGTTGQSKRLEGIYIRLANKPVSGSLQYRTHVQKIGWQGWKSEGKMAGTTGKSYRLEAIQIKLTGQMAKKYDVYYRVHAQKLGWMGWARNGEQAGTAGHAYRLESIQIKLVAKGSKAPGSTSKIFHQKGMGYINGAKVVVSNTSSPSKKPATTTKKPSANTQKPTTTTKPPVTSKPAPTKPTVNKPSSPKPSSPGSSTKPPTTSKPTTPTPSLPEKDPTPSEPDEPQVSGGYVANKNSGVLHHSWCSSAQNMKESNKIYYSYKPSGYTSCKVCKP